MTRGLPQAAPPELHRIRRGALLRAGQRPRASIDIDGTAVGLIICEDVWFAGPARQAQAGGRAGGRRSPTARPITRDSRRRGASRSAPRARETGLPFVYVNRVGGQDELVFDGAIVRHGRAEATSCSSCRAGTKRLRSSTLEDGAPRPVRGALDPRLEYHVYEALVMGVRDYVDEEPVPGRAARSFRRRGFRAGARGRGRRARDATACTR